MNKRYAVLPLWIILTIAALAPSGAARAQTTVLGIGPTAVMPVGERFSETNSFSYGASLLFGSRKYCRLWTAVRLDLMLYQPQTPEPVITYDRGIAISPELRYFPFDEPTTTPFYAEGMIALSGITGSDSASRSGLGAGLGIGYLFPYSSHCDDWFLDLNIRYFHPNLLRSESRPAFASLVAGLSFNFGL